MGPVAAAPVRRRPATEDARAVDEVLRQQYGGQRPVLPSSAAAETPTPPVEASISTRPAWLKGGGKRTQAQPLKRTYGVPTGAELSVQLLRPLDSRLTSSGPVAAKLRRSLVVGGALVLPASTLLYGTAAANQAGRFDIRFSRLRLPDNTEVSFEGLAYDAADKKPGLHATHRILPDAAPSTGPSVGEAVLKSVASATLSQVPADAVADVAKTGAQAAISRAGEGSPSGAAAMPAILLDAPHDFVVFVTAPF